MLANEDELRRLNSGPSTGELARDVGVVRFFAHCAGDAPEVLSRCEEVMRVVLGQNVERWPTDEQWHSLLPAWFVTACPDETMAAQAMQRWFELSELERLKSVPKAWSVGNWIYWFLPEERQWFWWDASIVDANTVEILVEVFGHPFPWGPLEWLLEASGAIKFEPDF
jgi:hypothetical protein